MKKNMGSADKAVRLIVAAALIGLYFADIITGITGIIAIVIATVFALTSFISFCPLYSPLGINTCKKK